VNRLGRAAEMTVVSHRQHVEQMTYFNHDQDLSNYHQEFI